VSIHSLPLYSGSQIKESSSLDRFFIIFLRPRWTTSEDIKLGYHHYFLPMMILFKAPQRRARPKALISPTATQELSTFYKTKGSVLCSKEPTNCQYPQPEESSLCHPTLLLYNQFQIILPSTPRFQGDSFFQVFPPPC
jgi:hypothetical protein